MDSDNIGDPVNILRAFQKQLMYGLPLNPTSSDSMIEGETVPIFIDQFRLLATTFDEMLQIYDNGCYVRTPLQVTFYDELIMVVDYGKSRHPPFVNAIVLQE